MQGTCVPPFILERYRSDPQFQLEIDYCSEGRIKHSEFLEWPEEDQVKATVWQSEQRLKCPDCGTNSAESDPSKGGNFHAYHVDKFTCYVCKNVEQANEDSRATSGKRKGQLPQGAKFRVLPNLVWQERKRLKRQKEILADRKDAMKKQQAFREGRNERRRQGCRPGCPGAHLLRQVVHDLAQLMHIANLPFAPGPGIRAVSHPFSTVKGFSFSFLTEDSKGLNRWIWLINQGNMAMVITTDQMDAVTTPIS